MLTKDIYGKTKQEIEFEISNLENYQNSKIVICNLILKYLKFI